MAKLAKIIVDVQTTHAFDIPTTADFKKWVALAVEGRYSAAELCIRIVAEDESAMLNQKYRHKRGATNILSFPFDMHSAEQVPYLGDLVVCAPLVQREAEQQHKSVHTHWAHLTIHGVLHLMGFDHESDKDALQMERVEINLLERLGIANPYFHPDSIENH